MFAADVYIKRREGLRRQLRSGLLLFLGNDESPMNYRDNQYTFRQDSSFLYYWGIDHPGLAALIDIDEDREVLFGDDPTMADIVWIGPQPLLREKAMQVGISLSGSSSQLKETLLRALRLGRRIHLLPQYRPDSLLMVEQLLGIQHSVVHEYTSSEFIAAVVAQRSVKTPEEIAQIESALDITCEMQLTAMRMAKPGVYEREVAGAMHGIALSRGGNIAFPIIFSIHGETLHNHHHGNQMQAGNIVVNDSGAESALHYAGDLTRTFPVSGWFSDRQKDVYRIVLDAHERALEAVKPGTPFREVHLLACRVLAAGLKSLGLMKGDTDEAVREGAHALFFQCGVGHMMGLDVHDMENLGEQFVGYEQLERSPQFGLCYLRLAKPLRTGFVVTVEPGLYFIPQLIDSWKAERRLEQFINYDAVERFKDFGGMRIEDDVLVTEGGYRLLGKALPRTIEAVEAHCPR
jgi:Xaa-Pro aminopeptidase